MMRTSPCGTVMGGSQERLLAGRSAGARPTLETEELVGQERRDLLSRGSAARKGPEMRGFMVYWGSIKKCNEWSRGGC